MGFPDAGQVPSATNPFVAVAMKEENLSPSTLKLQHELSLRNIIGDSLRIYSKNFVRLASFVLLIYFPTNVLRLFVPVIDAEQKVETTLFLFGILVSLLENAVGVVVLAVLAFLVHAELEGKTKRISEAFMESMRKLPILIGTWFLLGFNLMCLSVLLVVPAIIFSVYWCFTIHAVVFRGCAWEAAMSYSKTMVLGRWRNTLGYIVVLGLISVVVLLAVQLPKFILPDIKVVSYLLKALVDVVTALFTIISAVFFLYFEHFRLVGASKKEDPIKNTMKNNSGKESQ